MAATLRRSRPWTFYALLAFFCLFVLFLYGPMSVIYVLSFQSRDGGLTFPMRGASLHWFQALVEQRQVGDLHAAFARSLSLAVLSALLTVVVSACAGFAFRRGFRGSGTVFYLAVSSLVMPGIFVGLGIALTFQALGLQASWWVSGLAAQLTWTLPFGLLIMFAILGRLDKSYEEAAADLGASAWQRVRHVTLPIILPGLIGVALFGFTLSYDEFPRTILTAGSGTTLPIEIWTMTTNVTSPALYAVGTVTTVVSFIVIACALVAIVRIQRHRATRRDTSLIETKDLQQQ